MLEDVAIFSGLSQDDLELLEHHMVTRSFQKNTLLLLTSSKIPLRVPWPKGS